ncbi:MAG: hypothetical protein ACRDGQ_03970, partial [Candidatus Limnocylindrales bacterium]
MIRTLAARVLALVFVAVLVVATVAALPDQSRVLQTLSPALPDVECPLGVSPAQTFCYTLGNQADTGIFVSLATTSVGPALTGVTGDTLYVHTGDTSASSSCTDGYLEAWPALIVTFPGPVTGGNGVTGTFASFTRADDGLTQVTYNGMPLYSWRGIPSPATRRARARTGSRSPSRDGHVHQCPRDIPPPPART